MPLESLTERASNGGPILLDNEEVKHTEPHTSLFFNREVPEGSGTLYITTERVVWLDEEEHDRGFAFDYPFILLHAVSRDISHFAKPCIYCQLDMEAEPDLQEDEAVAISEAYFVPDNSETLQAIFDAMSECATLHPDPEEDDAGEAFYDQDAVAEGARQEAVLRHLENVIITDHNGSHNEAFEDASNDEDTDDVEAMDASTQ
eukprot:GILK01005722.1.p1 GENE.GILK01005722.1~~GILK01005722.1.p1  ORF type:complete len:216 (-),score=35.29 GILK01005722.1:176-784(-)